MPDLEAFASNLWLVDGPPVGVMGIPLPTRMIIVKLSNGSLWLNSPVSLPSALLDCVTSLGPVMYLVAPTKLHVWRLEKWHAKFPDAELWMPPQASKEFERLPVAGILGDTPPSLWADDFAQLIFRGNGFIEEVEFLHKPSGTVILTDFIQNHLPVEGRPLLNTLFKLAGVAYPQGGVAIDIRLSFTNRKFARQSLERLLSWDFDKLVLAHGICIKENAKSFVRHAFRWLLS